MSIPRLLSRASSTLVVLLLLASCSTDNAGPAVTNDSLGLVRFTIDGITRGARVDSLTTTGERMVAHGHWNEHVIAAGVPSTLLLECLLTAPARVGVHPVDSTSDSTSFFTFIGAIVGNSAARESFRAGKTGGSGSVTILEVSDTLVRGTMTFKLYNDSNRTETKMMTGEFGIGRK